MPLFGDKGPPDQIWLHHSGRLLTGSFVWDAAGAGPRRQLQLSGQSVPMKGKK